jgi:hypothetical protein
MPCTHTKSFSFAGYSLAWWPQHWRSPFVLSVPMDPSLKVAAMLRSLVATIGIHAHQHKNVFSDCLADIGAAPPHFHLVLAARSNR